MKDIVILIVAALLFCVPALAQRTEVNDAAAARMLLGKHMFSLQWQS